MEYIEKKRIPSKTKEVKHQVAQCVKCDCDNIKLDEYEDMYGYISTATCTNCKNEVKENIGIVGIIKAWNKQNDIYTLMKDKADQIIKLKQEIIDLNELSKKRREEKKEEKGLG